MPPTVHLIRHAQGHHNLSLANHTMHDPLLTPLGISQCRDLATTFPYMDRIDLIVASPLKRTIYTALYTFQSLLSKNPHMRVVALPEIQETSDLPCDTGSDLEELKREFKGKPVDLSLVPEGWNNKKGKWDPEAEAISERAREARVWLRERKEHDVAVVTHGGFLHYFTEDWTGTDKFVGTGWANTEFRSYTFDPESGDNASLVETPESRKRRRGMEKPLTKEEQRNLRETAEKGWSDAGFQKKAEPAPVSISAKLTKARSNRDWINGY